MGRKGMAATELTVEQIEADIQTTARLMVLHNMPELLPTLKRLEAYRDELIIKGKAIEYAESILDESAERTLLPEQAKVEHNK